MHRRLLKTIAEIHAQLDNSKKQHEIDILRHPYIELETYIFFKEVQAWLAKADQYVKYHTRKASRDEKLFKELSQLIVHRLNLIQESSADYGAKTVAEKLAFTIGKSLLNNQPIGKQKHTLLECIISNAEARCEYSVNYLSGDIERNSEVTLTDEQLLPLKNRLLKIQHHYFKSNADWYDFLLDYVNAAHWQTFLKDFEIDLGSLFESADVMLKFIEDHVNKEFQESLLRSVSAANIIRLSANFNKKEADPKLSELWLNLLKDALRTDKKEAKWLVSLMTSTDISTWLAEFNLEKSDLFTTREELLDFLAMKLPSTEWGEFLKGFNSEKLSALILQDQQLNEINFSQALQNITYDPTNPVKNKAIAYCLSSEYWTIREQSGEYKTLIAKIFGSWVAYSKTDKEFALNEFWRPFLLSMSSQLTKEGLHEFIDASLSEVRTAGVEEFSHITASMIEKILYEGSLGQLIVNPALTASADVIVQQTPTTNPTAMTATPAPSSRGWFGLFGASPTPPASAIEMPTAETPPAQPTL